ncbi:thioredoxin domain-containing protein [Hyphomicrobiales bacterium FT118]|uniref:Thioredoxin domain-containing protein n=2 Tax=Futiania mangrovi TaxID=2959716 RepID=A0A9J6PIX6_9PROT|nr:thioredoxin domain-containing protein [Futiania mangrovii]MCP1336503.1 thioredoxin domain-containing protein [Futiania mangrovii]
MSAALPQANLLADETSPYLLQHADNPVHWRAWGPEALAEARRYDKPILLSVGYAACHWCHVMAHESFEDPEIAGVMNELFVNIKVDREERPDIDAIYQAALQMLGEHGGWPLTMFLTPGGEPFFGGTYFPPTARYGRPGFPTILREVHRVFHAEPEKITHNRKALAQALQAMNKIEGEPLSLSLPLLDEIAERLGTHIDRDNGGIGGAPKFPQVSLFDFFWRTALRTGNATLRDGVLLTLDQMALGGIRDHLGGGFARYTVDARWLVPHFEKMLYDNAQLLRLYAHAWAETESPLYRRICREIVAWTRREMMAPDGGFASSLDADSEGEEGRFYVWTAEEIRRVLGEEDFLLFARVFDVTSGGNWEGKTILNRLSCDQLPSTEEEARLDAMRATLHAVREGRIRPGRDDKVLADWNGLMIAALADAGRMMDEPDWIALAEETFAFIVEAMTRDGRLLHSYRQGQARHAATLDDHAFMIEAAVTLYEATADSAYLDWATHWADVLDTHYRDGDGGAYFFTADDAEALIVRTKSCSDASTPSGNGMLAGTLARLHLLTGDSLYRERAEEIAATFAPLVHRNVFPLTALFCSWETIERPAQVTVIGDPDDPDTEKLLAAAHRAAPPSRALQAISPGTALPETHPAADKVEKSGVYICIGPSCSLPVSKEEAIRLDFAQRWKTTNPGRG